MSMCAVAVASLVAFAVLKWTTWWCDANLARSSMESEMSLIAMAHHEGLLSLPEIAGDSDGGTAARWLAVTSAAGETMDEAQGSAEVHTEAEQAIKRAMGAGDRQQAEKTVKVAMGRAMGRWRAKRKKLKNFLHETRSLRAPKLGRTPAQKASVASCVFDVLQTTTQLAALAANIKDATETCEHVRFINHTAVNNWPGKVCALNVESIFYSV